MDDKQAFFVEAVDGRKFKMVIRGDLRKLSVTKIRRYLQSYGVPDGQVLLSGDQVLSDDMTGEDFNLSNNACLRLKEPTTAAPAGVPSAKPPATHGSAPPPPPPQPQQPSSRDPPLAGPRSAWADSSPSTDTYNSKWGGGSERVAAGQPSRSSPGPTATQLAEENETLTGEVEALRREVRRLESDKARLEQEVLNASARPSALGATTTADKPVNPLQNAKENLVVFSDNLGVPLEFDSNLTCVIGDREDFTLMLTYDPATERLYLYSTVLNELPPRGELRVKLYEILLEGALLGREVCGGGIGVSLQNGIVVLSTSLLMGQSSRHALSETVPVFVETMSRWRSLVNELIE